MLTAEQVADYFLRLVDEDAGDGISNLKLQKLVYYAQAWHLAITDEPLFLDEIEAWKHGPVVPSLYIKYKRFGWESIRPSAIAPAVLSMKPWEPSVIRRSKTSVALVKKATKAILGDVWETYGQFSAKRLEELTHSEDPWIDARQGCKPHEASSAVISRETMHRYYAQLGDVLSELRHAAAFDALAADAIREYRAGHTTNLRALALD